MSEEALEKAYNRGLLLESKGDIEGAVAAYHEALALDPDDPGGLAVRLAALGAGPTPETASPAYVELLFEQHAGNFEDILVRQLHYSVPTLLREKFEKLGLSPFARMLDLGCGTGLCGEALREYAGEIIGIDIAETMVDFAEDKDVYDGLYVGEILSFLEDNEEEPFDVVVAADVLPYLGAVEPLFAGVATCLRTDGVFAFSTEMLRKNAAGARYAVGRNRRFLHAETYLRDRLAAAGFTILAMDEINVRDEDGAPSPGHLVMVRRNPVVG
jgi:predicted TPR repeat methyltransferase